MRRRILSLVRIESTNRSGLYQASLPKRELAKIKKNISNLYKYFSGIVNMQQLPDAVIVFDVDMSDNVKNILMLKIQCNF